MITGRDIIFVSSIESGFLWQIPQEVSLPSQGARRTAPGVHVVSLLVMPPFVPPRRLANRFMLRLHVAGAARGLGMRAPIIWTFLPTDTSAERAYAWSAAAPRLSALHPRDGRLHRALPQQLGDTDHDAREGERVPSRR
jgi:hypothetical protein